MNKVDRDNLIREIEIAMNVNENWPDKQKTIINIGWKKFTINKIYKRTKRSTNWQWLIKWGLEDLFFPGYINKINEYVLKYIENNINLNQKQISSAIKWVDWEKYKNWVIYRDDNWFLIKDKWIIHYFDKNGIFQLTKIAF